MGTTIFIVDDEKNIRRTVRMVLEGEGYAVEDAGSGEEALARLPDVAPDVILLDVQLPGISGHDVLEVLRKVSFAPAEAGERCIRFSGEATRPRAPAAHPAQRTRAEGHGPRGGRVARAPQRTLRHGR